MAQPTFREILTSIKKGKELAPVYILHGEEPYFIDTLVEAFENFVVDEEDRDFNQQIFYGNDCTIEEVVASAQQFPVMASRKLVVLKEAQTMTGAKAQLDKMAPYIGRPNKSTVLVVVFKVLKEDNKLSATSKLLKSAASSEAVVFKSDPVKEWQLESNVRDYCSSIGFNIDDKSCRLLCEYIGTPLSKLYGEINKLVLIKGTDKRITPEDIEKHIGVSKDYNAYEFANAVQMKDYPKAIRILKYFSKNQNTDHIFRLTGTLFNLFQKYVIFYYLTDKSDAAVMEALGMKRDFELKKFKQYIRNYNAFQAVNAIHALREFDAGMKGVGSYQDKYQLLGDLIFKIFTF